MIRFPVTFDITTLDQLKKMVEFLLTHLHGSMVLLLKGDLGAGKTTFVRILSETLGLKDNVQSPTFSLHHRYTTVIDNNEITIDHFDLYRLAEGSTPHDLFDLDISKTGNIVCIEWFEKVNYEWSHFGIPVYLIEIMVEFPENQEDKDSICRTLVFSKFDTKKIQENNP